VLGAIDDAYAHAREAVLQDPSYAGAYNTLGVVYQRRGLVAASERAYRAALARDNNHKPGLQNLARVLRAQGRDDEALPYETRLAQLERDPPFSHFDRGVAAVKERRYAAGRDHLLREMQRDGDYHEFHFWLAQALYGLGDVEQARQHLDTAMRNSTTVRDRALYGAKLRSLDPADGAIAVTPVRRN
jgi:tetratricopeptide (TPR) repeat protein